MQLELQFIFYNFIESMIEIPFMLSIRIRNVLIREWNGNLTIDGFCILKRRVQVQWSRNRQLMGLITTNSHQYRGLYQTKSHAHLFRSSKERCRRIVAEMKGFINCVHTDNEFINIVLISVSGNYDALTSDLVVWLCGECVF